MTDWGLTSTGPLIPAYSDIHAEMADALHSEISPRLVLDGTTSVGQVTAISAYHESLVWQALATLVAGLDPETAGPETLPLISKLTGVARHPATFGTVDLVLTWDLPGSAAAGQIVVAHATTSVLWANVAAVGSPAGDPVTAAFRCLSPGYQPALAHSLERIAQGVTGLASVTQAADATPGQEAESIEALRIRRRNSPAATGGGTPRAIQAAVAAVPGVEDVRVWENDSYSVDPYGQAPGTLRVVVWDGLTPAAANADIFAAIWSKKPGGIPTLGGTTQAIADPTGGPVPTIIRFDRATPVTPMVAVTVSGSASLVAIKDALLARVYAIGATCVWSQLVATVVQQTGVTDATVLLDGGAANVTIDPDEIIVLTSANVSVVST